MEETSVTFKVKVRALVLEAFALTVLCYVGGWTTMADNSIGTRGSAYEEAFANAGAIFTMILFSFDVSGAQLNPAVSVALSWLQQQPWSTTALYVLAQMIGSVLGGVLLHFVAASRLKDELKGSFPIPNLAVFSKWNVFWHEFLGTFFLYFIFYHIKHIKGNKFHMAFAIFAVLIMNIFCLSNITGAAFNPARVFGPSLVENRLLMTGWYLYWVAPCLGAIAGGIVHKSFIQNEDFRRYLPSILVQLVDCVLGFLRKGLKVEGRGAN